MDKSFLNDKKCVDFLSMYKPGEYIYPSVVTRNLRISMNVAEDFLNMLVAEGICEKRYRHFCTICMREVGSFMEQEETEEVYCDNCDSLLTTVNTCFIVKRKAYDYS